MDNGDAYNRGSTVLCCVYFMLSNVITYECDCDCIIYACIATITVTFTGYCNMDQAKSSKH